MKAKPSILVPLITFIVITVPCQGSSDEELATRCRFAKKCFSERVEITQEVESLRTISSTSQGDKVDSRVEALAARTRLYSEVCAPHLEYFFKLLKDPPGGMDSLKRCCGTNYLKEVGEILAELPLVGPVKK